MAADSGRSRILIPMTVFLTVGGLFAALWGVVNDRTLSEVGLRTSLTAEQVTDRLEEQVHVCFRVMRGLQEEWESGQITSQAVFEQRAGSMVSYFTNIAAIEVLDESSNVKWRVASKIGKALDVPSYLNIARIDPHTGKVAEGNAVRVSQAFPLWETEVGIVAFLPLRSHEASSLRVTLIVSLLIEDSLLGSGHGDFAYVVDDEGLRLYASTANLYLAKEDYTSSRPVAVANRIWTVRVVPLPNSMEAMLSFGTNMVLICGLLVAGSMAFVSARLLSNQQRLRDNEERLRTIAEHIPGVVYSYEISTGTQRTLIYLGPGLDALIGPKNAARVSERFEVLFELVHPDDRERVASAATFGSKAAEMVDCEARLLTDDGSYRWIRSLGRPRIVDRDRTRWHVVLIDIMEHRRTVDALRESKERYRVLVESSPVGVMIHRDTVFQFVNPAAVKLLGYERAEDLVGKEIFVVIPPGSHDVVRQRIARTGPESEPLRFRNERLVRRDGSEVDAEVIASRINFEGRSVQQTLVLDTTEQRQAERRQRLLMQELDHRVKNNLASVLALLDQTAVSTNDFGQFRTKFSNRIKAMARTHEILARSSWSGAELKDIMHLSLAPHVVDDSDRVRVEGASLVVCPRSALPIGLALHELATNALKHGSLSAPGGRVEIRSEREDECVVLRWTESGGPPTREPEESGTGLRLVRGLVEFELGGTAAFDFNPQGLVCTLRIDTAVLTDPA